MAHELFVIIKRNRFWYGLFSPIFFTLLLNSGIILSIPNQIYPLQEISNYISTKVYNGYSLQILIGLFTVFVVFFTFAQFSYSNKTIPTFLIRKYIIEADVTVFYLGCQFGFILILGYFAGIDKDYILRLNILINLIFLFFSAGLSVIYFFWITKHVQASNVFKLILNHLNIREIISTEQRYFNNIKSFENFYRSIKASFKIKLTDPLDFLISNRIVTITYKKGTVLDINLNSLIELLEPYKEYIHELILNLKIGDFIPNYEPLPDLKPKTILIKIIPVLNIPDEKIKELKSYLEEKRIYIERQFSIDDDPMFSDNLSYIRDLMEFYFYAAMLDSNEGKYLINEMNAFLIKEIDKPENYNWISSVGLTEKLYLEAINIVEENLKNQSLSKGIIEATLSFIYTMKYLAIENKSLSLMKGLIRLLNILLYDIIIDGLRFRFYLSTLILYIKEITIQSITYNEITVNEYNKYEDIYYKPIIINAIDQAIITYYHLILHFNKMGAEEGGKILEENGNQLIDFLFPLNHWKPFEDFISDEKSKNSEKLGIFVKYFAENLIYLAISIFMRIERKELPEELFVKIAIPLVDNCTTIFKHFLNKLEIIDGIFYDYHFNNPDSSFFGQVFESKGIHEYGSYSPTYYGFSRFWIAYSFYNRKHGGNFIPQKSPIKEFYDRNLLERIQKQLETIDYPKYSLLLGDSYNLQVLNSEYSNHIKNLLGNASILSSTSIPEITKK